MSSGLTVSRDRTTHIYDDIHVPVPRAETFEEQHYCQPPKITKETFPTRISHHYEKVVGLAKTKKNRMCVFGIVSSLVAIFSLTGAIIFSIFYAKPAICDKLLKANTQQSSHDSCANRSIELETGNNNDLIENWLMVCKPSGNQGGTSIICPESKSVVITKVNITWYTYTGQTNMPNCDVSPSCIKPSDNITDYMRIYCAGKPSCVIDSKYLNKHSKSCQEQGYDLLEVTFLCS